MNIITHDSLTVNRRRQLDQVARLDPQAHARAVMLYQSDFDALATKVVSDTLKRALAEGPDLWQLVVEAVESGKLPHITGKMQKIAPGVYLRNRHDGHITLYAGRRQSGPIARWGRDFDNANSAYVGKWKFTDDARRNFEAWARVAI